MLLHDPTGLATVTTAGMSLTAGDPVLNPETVDTSAGQGRGRLEVEAGSVADLVAPLLAGFGGLPGLLERNPHQAPCFINALEVEFVDPDDITHALMYLASDESRYVTGTAFNVDAGNLGR